MIQSLSYGAFNPSIEMQRRMEENAARRAAQARANGQAARELHLEWWRSLPEMMRGPEPSLEQTLYWARHHGLI